MMVSSMPWQRMGTPAHAGILKVLVSVLGALVLQLLCSEHARALMAGALPDTPAARIDPNTTTSLWSGVGSVVVNGGIYSGVVVAPRFVLTASHVVGSAPAASIQFVLNFGADQSHVIQAQAVTRYPTASFPYDDLALIELSVPVPPGVAIHPLAREPLTSAQVLALVGHGASGNGDVGTSVAASRTVKRTGRNMLDVIETTLDNSGRSSLFYMYDFDGPSGAGSFGGPTLGNALETLVASGDSGSPAFIGAPGSYRLVGINTFVASPVAGEPASHRFGMLGGGMLLTRPEFLNWIDTVTGYTTPNPVAVPTLPQWASIIALTLLGAIGLRSRALRARA